MIHLLDHGYVKLIESYGSDSSIVEAARMSTAKGFTGWGDPAKPCTECQAAGRINEDDFLFKTYDHQQDATQNCKTCAGLGYKPGDEKLLNYLWSHKHYTPFEMAGMIIEVKAPLFVFREWHRHRTQSYNELSARYVQMPDENYLPNPMDLVQRSEAAAATKNRQASGTGKVLDLNTALADLDELARYYMYGQQLYDRYIRNGWPKELARLPVPVARYSKMRAHANLRNLLHFLSLRMDLNAQQEIREYANTVGIMVKEKFPRTWQIFTNSGAI